MTYQPKVRVPLITRGLAQYTINIAKIAGTLLIGHLLQWGLLGALSVQVYIYHLAFPDDSPQRKVMVYAVYAIELVQTIFFSKTAFGQFATGFGDFKNLNESGLRELWFALPILSSVVVFVVQTFYAYRIRILAESNIVAIVIILLAFVQLGGGIAQGVIAKHIPSFSAFLVKKVFIATGISNGGSALCDMIIAISMTYYLSRQRTPWRQTQRILQKITFITIETGTLTAVFAIFNFVLFLIPGHPTYYQTTSAILGKLSSNTLMVVLNSRIKLSQDKSLTGPPSLAKFTTNLNISRGAAPDTPHNGIMVTREQRTTEDFATHGIKGIKASYDGHAESRAVVGRWGGV